jgi:hypothetical protein
MSARPTTGVLYSVHHVCEVSCVRWRGMGMDGSAVAQGKVIYKISSGRQASLGSPLLGTSGPGDANGSKNGGLK